MTAATNVPLMVDPEAAARLVELGMHSELEHTRLTVPGLVALRVVLRPVYDCYEATGITIEAVVNEHYVPDGPTWWEWNDWLHATFPPRVFEHFEMWPVREAEHAG